MIILTMLGMGNYDSAKYQWEGKEFITPYVQEALHKFYPSAEVKILATEEASKKHEANLKELVKCLDVIRIPSGSVESEYWDIFLKIADSLPEKAEVIFDITHGFRSLPMLAFLAVAYLRVARQIKLKALVYGSYQLGRPNTEITPIIDLTPFVVMLDWASAAERFLETGDAQKFKPLIQAQGQRPVSDNLNTTAKLLQPLSQALSLIRPIDTINQANEVYNRITKARKEEWAIQHEPFKLILNQLEKMVEPLAIDQKDSKAFLIAQHRQIHWYLKHNQHEKASALAREWLVSVRIWSLGQDITPINDESRKEAELWLNDCSHNQKDYGEEWNKTIELWRNLGNLRNDLMHCGMRSNPSRLVKLPEEVEEKIMQLPAAVLPLGLDLEEESPK